MKPPAVSVLKGLSPARQRALYEFMEERGGRTNAECLAWIHSAGVRVTGSELARWRAWYVQRLRFQWCREITALMADDLETAGHLFNLLLLKTRGGEAWKRHGGRAARERAMAAIERKMERELAKYDHRRGRD
ncbi:MAG TPA: hypothetical protein VGO59_02985 [Verrucomicrobiae bacterium]